MEIKLSDWYGLHKPKNKSITFNFKPGVNFITGCNGSGKSTTIRQIYEFCKDNDISVLKIDNLLEGRFLLDEALQKGDYDCLAVGAMSSEGQKIRLLINQNAKKIGEFHHKSTASNSIILFDAIDSGLDIPGCNMLKDFFDLICKHQPFAYIILSFNNYAMIDDIDTRKNYYLHNVQTGEMINISSYEEYKKLITSMGKKINNDII